MTQNRKENTHNPPFTQNIFKEKVMFPSSKRKKSWISRMHVATSHWLTKILILEFLPHTNALGTNRGA